MIIFGRFVIQNGFINYLFRNLYIYLLLLLDLRALKNCIKITQKCLKMFVVFQKDRFVYINKKKIVLRMWKIDIFEYIVVMH